MYLWEEKINSSYQIASLIMEVSEQTLLSKTCNINKNRK